MAKTILQENLLQDIASIAVKDLAGLTGESAAFFEYDGKEIKLIAKSEVANSYHYLKLLSSDVHSPNNAFIYSILPFIPTQESDSFFAKNELVFNFDESLVKDDFDAIREKKYFIRKERYERADITRICVPVFGKDKIVGSVGVTINSHNVHAEDMEQILQHCLATARSIEYKL
ncbi:IclR family transcriptional regulator C-terminal domain-containing protein [Lentisphaera marina]|uniref:IclR family transcriptional regulator C-terminal domain-containing protein n=1 Tax=Lentisphaera marina TaxID=1111041 RepID=UPI002365166B|nr:IclR family transcriptional regulator C-terminal domain-containing protein [Lentisphaera marina]MDD7983635.1 IclR family transcriptional regulator C-terminal domain-containing protein [Lentisphaera marina]